MSSAAAVAVVGQQTPRLHVAPTYVSSSGVDAIEVAEVAGLHLDPWQKLVLTDALGETPEGRWAAYRVGLEVARQNGKGGVLEARELAGLFAFGERLIIHSAHEQATATEHFNRLLALIDGVPEFRSRMLKPSRGKGQEAIKLRDGSRIFFKTRTGGGGRGFTGDLVVFDEAMMLAAAFMAALVPTMAARSMEGDPQLWFAGSAVDQQKSEHGLEFARVRADALAGAERLAYFGWSAPFESPDTIPPAALADPDHWAQANPGMGIRISPEYIADELGALGAREFAVERLGVGDWPRPDEDEPTVIDLAAWTALVDDASELGGVPSFAFAVTPDRSRGAIAAAGRRGDGLAHGELGEHRAGTGWMVDRLAELATAHPKATFKCNGTDAATSLLPELAERRVKVDLVGPKEYAQACGLFFDKVEQQGLRHLGSPELEAAIKGATRRPLGDAWAWSRKSGVDISPLVAFTIALWGAESRKPPRPAPFFEVIE